MGGINPWRGERRLAGIPGFEDLVLAATPDTTARVMDALGVNTLEAMGEKLAGRHPAAIAAALAELTDAETVAAVMAAAPGAAGLTALYGAIYGALSGLTPEEEAEAKKELAAAELAARATAVQMLGAAMMQASQKPRSGTG